MVHAPPLPMGSKLIKSWAAQLINVFRPFFRASTASKALSNAAAPQQRGLTPRSTPDPLRKAAEAWAAAYAASSQPRLTPPASAVGISSNVRPRMPAQDPRSYLATGKARTFAYLMDLCACALLLVPTAYATYLMGTPSAGAFEYALLFAAYHAYFLALKGGVSPGKFVQSIAVVGPNGRPLQLWQALARSALLALPWLLLSADHSRWALASLSASEAAALRTAGAAWLAFDLILIEFARDRRSLTDRIAATVVVALPPPEPHRAPAVPMFSAGDAEFGTPPKKPPQR
jgi:uncharacterized RDD family membrane protein YckC